MRVKKKPPTSWTLEAIRAEARVVRAQGLQIISHYKRLEQEYSDWEDRLNNLDKVISQAEDEYGLTKEEIITEPSTMNDFDIELTPEQLAILEE